MKRTGPSFGLSAQETSTEKEEVGQAEEHRLQSAAAQPGESDRRKKLAGHTKAKEKPFEAFEKIRKDAELWATGGRRERRPGGVSLLQGMSEPPWLLMNCIK
jgi:hypothetical protein